MSQKQDKKLRQLYTRDLSVKTREVFKYFVQKKPWYIPKKLWVYWLIK